jgi:hypothetical protein
VRGHYDGLEAWKFIDLAANQACLDAWLLKYHIQLAVLRLRREGGRAGLGTRALTASRGGAGAQAWQPAGLEGLETAALAFLAHTGKADAGALAARAHGPDPPGALRYP